MQYLYGFKAIIAAMKAQKRKIYSLYVSDPEKHHSLIELAKSNNTYTEII